VGVELVCLWLSPHIREYFENGKDMKPLIKG